MIRGKSRSVERAITNSSPPGATVLDPFCGAGTRLACRWHAGRAPMPSRPACRERKKNGRPCRAPALRAGSACFWHAAETREAAAEARRLGGCAAGARGRSGAPTPWRGSARAPICSGSWSWRWRWRTRWSWRTPSRARGRSRSWCPWRPGSRRPPRGRRACGRWRTACGGRRPMRDRERRLRRVTTRMTVRQRVAALLAAGPGNTAVYDDIGRGLTPRSRGPCARQRGRVRLHRRPALVRWPWRWVHPRSRAARRRRIRAGHRAHQRH